MRISACVITFNEADRIGACLASLQFCDDIVVIDSYSTDATREIAAAMGARVFSRHFDGFRSQKQFAITKAAHDWVLCLDADERVSDTLRVSIAALRLPDAADAAGYRFARCSYYFGRFLRHGNAYPDRVLRLFDRRRGGWHGDREIHESVRIEGPVRRLSGDLIHYPFRSFAHQLNKSERYARMMAEHEHRRGGTASLPRLLLSPVWRFLRGYVLRLGFLDGWQGLIYAFVSANYVRQKSIMLWMLQHSHALESASPPARATHRSGAIESAADGAANPTAAADLEAADPR
jgi:glycosyltransferase involved in cell wall biosynthesis